jgi:hypothetical protein
MLARKKRDIDIANSKMRKSIKVKSNLNNSVIHDVGTIEYPSGLNESMISLNPRNPTYKLISSLKSKAGRNSSKILRNTNTEVKNRKISLER